MKRALQTRITGKGQTAIPVAIQEAIGAKPGLSLGWEVRRDGECVVKVVGQEAGNSAMAMLGFAKTFRKVRRTSAWLKNLGGSL